jgi:hypothetical protein
LAAQFEIFRKAANAVRVSELRLVIIVKLTTKS